MKKTLLLALFFNLYFFSYGQQHPLWTKIAVNKIAETEKVERKSTPKEYQAYHLDFESLKTILATAPAREESQAKAGIIVAFPSPTGTLQNYRVYEASIMHPDLANRYKDIKSYIGLGIDDPTAMIRFSTTVFGLHTMTFAGSTTSCYIDPLTKDLQNYIVYSKDQLSEPAFFECQTVSKPTNIDLKSFASKSTTSLSNSGIFRTFRLALSSTVEYSNYHIAAAGQNNGTTAQKKAAVLAAMVVTMTRVNGVYERECAITMQIIADNDQLISIGTDNFSNTSGGALLGQNQNFVDGIITNAGYDIGHIFSTGGGGVAQLGSVCATGNKAMGVTGSPAPVNDAYNIDYVAHEMGHQFGGNHTFSSDQGSCNGNRNDGTAIEPGSGTTIMAYAGICPPHNVQAHSEDHFSVASLAEIEAFVIGGALCSVNVANNNPAPTIAPLKSYSIPIDTPFVLKGNATDSNNPSTLTYCWEQIDNEESTQPPSLFSINGPNFRSRTPSTSPDRYMPVLSSVVANNLYPTWEVTSAVGRTMDFSLTVRDNANPLGGQTSRENMSVTVVEVGPFLVNIPNTNVSWAAGSNQIVTWDIGGTTANGINTPYVDIYLSTNAGTSFPTLLASKVPNDGSETIIIPNTPGTTNRIMVMGHDNIFYDISNANFTISAATNTFAAAADGEQQKSVCQGSAITYDIAYSTIGTFTSNTVFTATGNPTGSTVAFTPSSINATGAVALTITTATTTPVGSYTIAVTATSGAIVKTINFYLTVVVSTIPTVTLTAPANLSVAAQNNLLLSWTAATGATAYDVQIATDNAFTNIISTATVTTNSYTVNGLNNATDYFWRVAAKNAACTGAFSAPFKFTTSYCSSFAQTAAPTNISSGGSSTVNSILTIPAANNAIVNDISVTLNITHTFINDLTVTLISPAGTQVQLFAHKCSSSLPGFENAIATFDDNGSSLVCGYYPAISGTLAPAQPLAVLNGQSLQGNWTLRVNDSESGDGGKINSWSLNACSALPSLGIQQPTAFDFSVYPNPNNGSFTIQSDRFTSEKIQIQVYDMRGRSIYQKDYTGNTSFNENISIANAEAGVYLLAVSDGTNKEIKRIIIK